MTKFDFTSCFSPHSFEDETELKNALGLNGKNEELISDCKDIKIFLQFLY